LKNTFVERYTADNLLVFALQKVIVLREHVDKLFLWSHKFYG